MSIAGPEDASRAGETAGAGEPAGAGKPGGAGEPAGARGSTPASTTAGAGNMLPTRRGRGSRVERGFVRLVATTGVIGIDVLLGAVLTSNKVQGWIIGLVIGVVSVVLAAVLWSSRQM